MSGTKHTPGPWRALVGADAPEPSTAHVCAMRGQVSIYEAPLTTETEANAHLIAAAPELRSAIEAALAWLRDPDANPIEEYGRIAQEYRCETGFMRPGESAPLESGEDPMSPENIDRFDRWCEARSRKVLADLRAAIAKAEGRAP